MRIGDLAKDLGTEPHVLRHWEDEGLLRPARDASGYRAYDSEQVTRARVIVNCRDAGLPLAVIAVLLDRRRPGRAQSLEEALHSVQRQRQRLEVTERFLDHVRACRHSLMHRCPECATFAGPTGS